MGSSPSYCIPVGGAAGRRGDVKTLITEGLVSRVAGEGGLSSCLWRRSLTDSHSLFRLIGEKTGNVARGINIAVVNCK